MPRPAAILHLLVGGAIMAPLLAFGHACEFLVAKMEVREGTVQMEITADYGSNPMLPDEESARAAIQRILQVRANGQTRPLADLAPLTFEHRQRWDPATPASFAPPPDGQQHDLVTAIWRWQSTADMIAFGVPKGSPNDILFWTTADHLPGKQVQWMLLIEGESTPAIEITGVTGLRKWRWWWSWIPAPALGAVIWLVRSRRVRILRA